MADINFYKYLEAAFRYRLSPQGARATLETPYNYLGYNLPFHRIFYYARRIFPSFYRTKFPDTEEGNLQMARLVLEKLDKHQDPQLDRYFTTPPEENIPVIEEAARESAVQQPPAVAPTTTGPLPGVAIRPSSVPRPAIKFGTTLEQPGTTQKTSESTGPAKEKRRPIFPFQKFNLSGLKSTALANTARNFGSRLGILFKKNVGKFLTVGRVATLVSAGIGAVAGSAFGPIGVVTGAGAGAAGSFWIKSGDATKFLSRVGNGAINAGVNISNQVSGGATRLSLSSGSKKLLWALLGAFILFFGVSFFGAVTETTPPGKAGPLPSPGGGDISNCKFTRGNANPPAESYKSPTLLSYFQQASAISSVPAAVLAAIARVESPTITNKTDADLPYLSSKEGCPRSDTGALGIMQIQPPGTRGYIQAAVNQGASYLGKTAEQLTGADFCDVKSSITIASGFILKKIQLLYGLGDGTKWDPSWTTNKDVVYKVAESYYGCLQYGGPDPLKCEGPYNYGDDIWTSIQNCRVQPSAPPGRNLASCPLVGKRTITCGSYGSDPIYNASFCNGPQPEDRGHCGRTYGSSRCGSSPEEARNSRRAHAIDVTAAPGETVYLPTIEGKTVVWNHIIGGSVPPADGGGYWHYFGAILGVDQWFLYLIHTNSDLIGLPIGKTNYESGDPVTTIAAITNPHVHVNIGKNPEGADSGAGWFNPEDIGMCTQ